MSHMKKEKFAPLLVLAAALVLLGFGCSRSADQTKREPPTRTNAYPGTEPYVAPTAPPPGQQPQ